MKVEQKAYQASVEEVDENKCRKSAGRAYHVLVSANVDC
jgi:hypothetical protein